MMIKRITYLLVLCVFLSTVEAATPYDVSYPAIRLICGLYKGFTIIGASIGSLVLIYSAAKYVTESDDPAARKNAKEMIKIVIMGLIIILMVDTIIYSVGPAGLVRTCSHWCSFMVC